MSLAPSKHPLCLDAAPGSAVERCFLYADKVLSGEIVACKKAVRACERFMEDLRRADTNESYPWRFDAEKAARPVDFIEKFLSPTMGDYDGMHLMPWQCFVECNLYGWVDKDTGLRRFREALILVGTGNGKSTLLAGNATYGACKDGERGAKIYLLANSKDQAGIVFNECLNQIKASKFLAPRFRTLRDGVHYDAMNATIQHRSSDSRRLDGLNPHMGIFDEIHEYRDFKLINIIKRKTVKRAQPLIIYITTMGYVLDGPLAYYYGLFSDAMEGRLDESVSDQMFAYICELDDADEIEDETAWAKANPSLGYLLNLDDLRVAWNRAKAIPSERADFICKQLNIMVNADDMAFVQPEILKRNSGRIDEESLLGRVCYGGFDLSNREDYTAAALEFPLDDGRVFVKQHSWVPRRKVEMDQEKLDYYGLAMQGYLTIVDGEYIHQEDVYEWFVKQSELYEIQTIGYDPANATRLRQLLEGHGFDCMVVRQGPLTLNDPMKDIKEMLLSGSVVSNEDPMLRWYTDNVRLSGERRHTEKENWMPTKRNRFRKIDGFIAWLCAHVAKLDKNPAGVSDAEPEVHVYEFSSGRSARRFF